jgi:hypothetical protein
VSLVENLAGRGATLKTIKADPQLGQLGAILERQFANVAAGTGVGA